MNSFTTTTTGGSTFASAINPSTAEDLLDVLAAYRPIETVTVETKIGTTQATVTQIIRITNAGEPVDLGERLIFWTVVRRQLAAASDAAPWVVGRLVKSGQAYRLDPMSEADGALAELALATPPF